jgi:hypothetical protein
VALIALPAATAHAAEQPDYAPGYRDTIKAELTKNWLLCPEMKPSLAMNV